MSRSEAARPGRSGGGEKSFAAGAGFATGVEPPWCPGCSYIEMNEKIQQVLGRLYDPAGVVLVSDIGCIGLVDKLYACHTVHGLHGRSVSLAAGLKRAHRDPELKVIVVIGDGGCAIGLQGLIEAARLEADLTVLAFDNQNYGMTGGQHSALTLPGVKTVTTPQGSPAPALDLVRLLEGMPGAFRARLTANDPRLPEALEQALAHRGFSYLESLNFCSSYAGKNNPELALTRARDFAETHGREFGIFPATKAAEPPQPSRPQPPPAPPEPSRPPRPPRSTTPELSHGLTGELRLLLGGSAGGGVQSAGALFARGAALCGLHVTLKSDYPVTVRKGHSTCELLLSPRPILFAAFQRADLAVILTPEGQTALAPYLPQAGKVLYQETLEGVQGVAINFNRHGTKNAAFHALALLLKEHRWFPPQSLREALAGPEYEKVRGKFLAILDELGV